MLDQRLLLMLMDGHALVHRAFHALPPLTINKTGEPIGAVYGFASALLKALEELKPTHCAIAFDRPTPTFRHLQFEEYKAQRTAAPDELRVQFKRIRELVEAFGIPAFEMDGYEADDILGTLSRLATEQGIDTIILTGDTDELQLVSPRVKALLPRGMFSDTILYDEVRVQERYGVTPSQIPDFKGLKGDPTDNIPGVPKIGEKTAPKLLQQFGTVDNMYAHIDDVTPPKIRDLLKEYEDQARQSVELARIVTDVPIELNLKHCQRSIYDRETVVALFRELEFSSLLERLPKDSDGRTAQVSTADEVEVEYITVTSEAELNQVIQEIRAAGNLAFDAETTSLNAMEAELVGISISTTPGKAYYIPVGHQDANQLPLDLVLNKLKPIFTDEGVQKVGHNANYDMMILENYDVPVHGLANDSMLAAFVIGEQQVGLKPLSLKKLGVEMTPITALIGTGSKQITMDTVAVDAAAPYACADADMTLRLSQLLEEEVKGQGRWDLLTDIEMPLVPVLVRMQRNGVALDADLLRNMSLELGERMGGLETSIYDSVGHRFKINSSQQLGDVLFKELQLPSAKRTKTGYSTDASVLEGLVDVHPIAQNLLDYRQITKLKSTYLDALPNMVNPRTGRIHTSFNQAGAITGRVSSNDPNLQNIPVRSELGGQVRNAFIAEGAPDWLLLAADYSQVDLRILAHISEDENLVQAFQKGEDIHASTASQVYGVEIDSVDAEMRRIAKVINFGIVYGVSGFGLAARTNLSQEEANEFISAYFDKYPRVKEYMEYTKRQAKEKGYVETVMGRLRYAHEIDSSNHQVRMAAERMAINMPVQGTSAEVIKLAMIQMQERMDKESMRTKMILQVHDELIFEAPKEELEDIASLAQEIMPHALELKVPLKVDIKTGFNWGEME